MVPNICLFVFFFFLLSHFNAAIFLIDNFCNCLNSSTSFGKKKKKNENGCTVFELISILWGVLKIDLPLKSQWNE